MNVDEKKQFVKEFTQAIEKIIENKIDGGEIPEDWGCVELRWLVRDSAEYIGNSKEIKERKKKYKNDVVVNNLL